MDPKLIEAVSSILWPLLLLIFFIVFRNTIKDLFKSGRKFSVKVAGNELTFEEVTEQQRTLLSDLQTKIAELELRIESININSNAVKENTAVEEKYIEPVKTVLWVDDSPKNNSYLIAHLKDLGVDVTISLSTDDALNKLERKKYDRIISDMGRPEGGQAGIDLAKKVRETGDQTPIFIFCGGWAAKNMREKAINAGVQEITASSSELLRALDLENKLKR